MSDCFDHYGDAFEAALDEGSWPRPNFSHKNWKGPYWTCKQCGRRHPPKHKACFWCQPKPVTMRFK